jgi:tyrosine-protein kinase Etk/Wzc
MSTPKINNEEREENLFHAIMFRFAPYWPLFLLLILVCGAGALVYLRFATPMYVATAKILLKDERKGADDSKLLESLNIYTSKKIVENEIEVIRSRTLMKDVVNRLRLYAPISQAGRIRERDAYAFSPVYIEFRDPDGITGASEVPFSYDPKDSTVLIAKAAYPLNAWVSTPYGTLRFIPNNSDYDSTGKQLYFSLINPRDVASSMVDRLDVSAVNKNSTVLNLYFKDQSPEKAQDILNALIESYGKSSIKEKNALTTNTLAFIDERLKIVVKDLEDIERKIQKYKSQQGIVDLSIQSKLFLQNVGDNDRKVSDISMQLAMLDQVEQYVESKSTSDGIVPATLGLNDNVLTDLLQRLYDTESQYNKLKETTAENSPTLVALANEIEKTRPAILENVRNQRKSLQASRKDLTSTNSAYASMLETVPQKERELLEISRQQSIKNSVYSFLLQKREETALSSSSAVPDSRLIDAGEAYFDPVSPKKSVAYMIAIALAVAIGVGIVMAKEMLTRKILFRSEIEKYTKVPIVAEITSAKHKDELVINNPDKVFITEQFRQLRAAIGLYGKNTSKNKILVTSSIAGEGKSFVASNLALSLALSGKRVVLLDMDLRSPKTTSIFNLESETGVAEYLQGKASLSKLVKSSHVNNLFVVPAGGVCENPTEFLINGPLYELFAHLESSFDYIIVDTSPIDPVTDAYVLSEYCDRTLFVIRHAYTPKTMVQLLDENNKIKALNNLAIVFNGVKKRGFINGSYGFGYGFGYEYVYKERAYTGKKKSRNTIS